VRKFVYLVLLITLAACHAGETENSNSDSESSSGSNEAQNGSKEFLEEKPTVTFTYEGEKIETNMIRGCFAPDCSEDSATVDQMNHEKMTEGLEPTQVEDGEAIQVHMMVKSHLRLICPDIMRQRLKVEHWKEMK